MKRLILVLALCAFLPAVIIAQAEPRAEAAESSPEVTRDRVPVDERTLLIGEASVPDAQTGSVSPFGFWDLARMVLVLAIVVAIIYLVFHFLKKAGGVRSSGNGTIRVIAAESLPGNKQVYLVQVGSQVFFLGGGSESVTLLSEITDQESVDAMILEPTLVEPEVKRSFSEMVAGLVQGGQAGSLSLIRQQRERLQRLR